MKTSPTFGNCSLFQQLHSHLTLQEYLAAVALAEQPDCEKIFCRAYFNPTLAEMEVLPMALGLVRKPDDFYAALEGLPESLNFANLRLRARGLAYVYMIDQQYLQRLTNKLIQITLNPDGNFWRNERSSRQREILRSFSGVKEHASEFIVNNMVQLLRDKNSPTRASAVVALGDIGGNNAETVLLNLLNDEDDAVRAHLAEALGRINGQKTWDALMFLLNDKERSVRASVAKALGEIGGSSAVEILFQVLKDKDGVVHEYASSSL